MSVEIIDFKLKSNKRKIASLVLNYYDLMVKCHLIYDVEEKMVWVRMPEKWIKSKKRKWRSRWSNKLMSDRFQQDVLNKIFDVYGADIEKVCDIHQQVHRKL